MRRADRLFQLVQLLRSRRFATAAWLAEQLEVSVRTIYRDVRDLVDSGIPIEGEAGVGYRMSPGYELPPLTFTPEEVEALVLGARIVEAWGDPALAEAARRAIGRIETVVPKPLREVLDATPMFAPRIGKEDRRVPTELRKAIGRRQKVRFGYTRADGTASERTVWPVGLYFWGQSWSVAAWCELRQGWRNFRPDRMQGLVVLDETFDPTHDLSAYVRHMEEVEGVPVDQVAGLRPGC